MQQSHFSPVYTWGLSKGSEYFLLHWSSLTKYQVTCCGRIKKKKKKVYLLQVDINMNMFCALPLSFSDIWKFTVSKHSHLHGDL